MSEYNEGVDCGDVDWKETATTLQIEVTRLNAAILEAIKVEDGMVEKSFYQIVGKMVAILEAARQ